MTQAMATLLDFMHGACLDAPSSVRERYDRRSSDLQLLYTAQFRQDKPRTLLRSHFMLQKTTRRRAALPTSAPMHADNR
jgi:hypothetical protein